jgi:hypothetical protein
VTYAIGKEIKASLTGGHFSARETGGIGNTVVDVLPANGVEKKATAAGLTAAMDQLVRMAALEVGIVPSVADSARADAMCEGPHLHDDTPAAKAIASALQTQMCCSPLARSVFLCALVSPSLISSPPPCPKGVEFGNPAAAAALNGMIELQPVKILAAHTHMYLTTIPLPYVPSFTGPSELDHARCGGGAPFGAHGGHGSNR